MGYVADMLTDTIKILIHSCKSTNEEALSKLKRGEIKSQSVVYTYDQTSGRGQRGNQWISEVGKNLTCSFVVFDQSMRVADQFILNIISSLAVFDFLKSCGLDSVEIKWPNDILVNKLKIAGILIQNVLKGNSIEASIIGIGLNINQKNFATLPATSLSKLTNQSYDLEDNLQILDDMLFKRLHQWKEEGGFRLKEEYLKRMLSYKSNQLFDDGNSVFSALVIGIDSLGRILLEIEGVQRAVEFGAVKWII